MLPAQTKSHRLFRAYLLTAALAAVARDSSVGDAQKLSVSGRLRGALAAEQEAYECLYPRRARLNWKEADLRFGDTKAKWSLPTKVAVDPNEPVFCLFFDERMARIEYAIYKLAADVMVDPDSQSLFNDVRNRLIADIPVIGSGIRTATKALDTAKEATATVAETTSLADSIINFSIKTSPRWIYLAPIYRDALELDMWVVTDSLRAICGDTRAEKAELARSGCDAFNAGLIKFASTDLSDWRHFLKQYDGAFVWVEAYPVHFAIVSRWLFNSCTGLFAGNIMTPGMYEVGSNKKINDADAALLVATKQVNANCAPLIEYQPLGNYPPFKISFNPRTDKGKPDGEHELNVKRAPLPAERPAVPAAAKLPAGADKARGEEK